MLIAIIVLTKQFSRFSSKELIGGTRFIDVSTQSVIYDAIFGLEGMLLILLAYRLICVFRINAYVDLVYHAIFTGFDLLAAYVFVLVVVLVSCALLMQLMWGEFHPSYTAFRSALFNTLTTIIGGTDYTIWLNKVSYLSVVYFILFFIWATFLLPNVIYGIFMESYRIAALEVGYPETKKAQRWGLKDYIRWAFGCCPMSVLHSWNLINDNIPEQVEPTEEKKVAQ